MTCSTSPCDTSLSRTPTTPWEFRLRTWLPAMPANTEWISQPAMSSASSTARWIDCTVDSMLTTTPFFSPRDGCEPTPSSSIEPSPPTSPTSDTTLEVPMSSPTIRFRSERLSIAATFPASGVAGAAAAPADGKPVCVTHVDVGDFLTALGDELQRGAHEFLEALVDLAPSEAHGDAVGEIELPGAARIEPQRRHPQSRRSQPPGRGEIALRHRRLLVRGAGQLGELGGNVAGVRREQLAAGVDEALVAPAGGGGLFDDEHVESARPGALHAHRVHPREGVDRAPHGREIHRDQPHTVELRFHHALDVAGRDALEAPRDRHRAHRLIERHRERRGGRAEGRECPEHRAEPPPADGRELQRAPGGLAAVAGASQHAHAPCFAGRG